jgi:germination protein M
VRKLLTAFLAGTLLLATGCAYMAANDRAENTYALYFQEAYLNTVPGGDALRAEEVRIENDGIMETQQLAEALLTKLLAGPLDETTLKSTIPAGTTLLSVMVEDDRATVDLSAPYSTLSGVALTMADYAITLTLTQLQAISSVSITVRGQELAYRDKQVFTARDVLLSSTEDVVGTVTATLYFLNESGGLTPEEQTLELYEGDTQVGAVVKALERGPEIRGLSSALPDGFQAKSVWLEEDICYVNFSSAALQVVEEPAALQLAVRVLERSLQSLDSVAEVRFLVDGELAAHFGTFPLRGVAGE